MKNYLMIYVGSRGCLEGIEGVGIEDIEGYLNGISEYNKDYVKEGFDECDDEDYVNEVLGYWDWSKLKEGVWEIGLGDEECKYYIDLGNDKFKVKGEEILGGWDNENWDFENFEDERGVMDFLNYCLYEVK